MHSLVAVVSYGTSASVPPQNADVIVPLAAALVIGGVVHSTARKVRDRFDERFKQALQLKARMLNALTYENWRVHAEQLESLQADLRAGKVSQAVVHPLMGMELHPIQTAGNLCVVSMFKMSTCHKKHLLCFAASSACASAAARHTTTAARYVCECVCCLHSVSVLAHMLPRLLAWSMRSMTGSCCWRRHGTSKKSAQHATQGRSCLGCAST